MEHKVCFSPSAQGTSEDLGVWGKTLSVSPGVWLVHALHDWERYKDPVEYRNMSHSHCNVLLEVGVSALTQSSVDRGKVGAL